MPIRLEQWTPQKEASIYPTTMALEPLFSNDPPLYLARYRVYVTVGTYVVYFSGESSYVGRILEVTRSQQIVVNCFIEHRTQLAHPNLIVAGRVTKESCKYCT
eukprot:scaffold47783_cov53-Attheya_sp.AAC.5